MYKEWNEKQRIEDFLQRIPPVFNEELTDYMIKGASSPALHPRGMTDGTGRLREGTSGIPGWWRYCCGNTRTGWALSGSGRNPRKSWDGCMTCARWTSTGRRETEPEAAAMNTVRTLTWSGMG